MWRRRTRVSKASPPLHCAYKPPPGGPDSDRKDNLRAKPLSGTLQVTVHGARELDHAPIVSGKSKSSKQITETVVSLKVEGTQLARSHPSRTDRWNEDFEITVDKANEVEIVVADKQVADAQGVPIGLLWIRISDLVEALRRQKVGMDSGPGWVTAGAMPGQPTMPNGGDMNSPLGHRDGGAGSLIGAAPTAEGIDAWFAVEPAGAILLHLNFSSLSFFSLVRLLADMRNSQRECPQASHGRAARRSWATRRCSQAEGRDPRDERTQIRAAPILPAHAVCVLQRVPTQCSGLPMRRLPLYMPQEML
jgi:hypothetical protein